MSLKPSCLLLCLVFSIIIGVQSQSLFGRISNLFRGLGAGAPRQRPGQAGRGGRVVGGQRGGACAASGPNHSFGGQQFIVTWRLG